MNKLSLKMITVLTAIYKHPRSWVSAYDIQCKTTTLDALVDRDMLRRKNEPGYLFNPRLYISYTLTELGKKTAEKLYLSGKV